MYNQTSWIVFLLVHEMSDGDDVEQLRQLIDGARAQRAGAQMDGSGAFMSLAGVATANGRTSAARRTGTKSSSYP